MWAASEDGIFRVRDAYKLALNSDQDTASSSGSDNVWRRIWKLNIPPKAKLFLWRATWDMLPHGANLRKKGIQDVDLCQRCGALETSAHVLKDCRWSREVWEHAMQPSDIPLYSSFKEWLGEVMDHKNQKEVEFFGVCAWQVWCARNDFVFDQVFIASDLCYKRAYDILEEYSKANAITNGHVNYRENVKWKPPPEQFIKFNVDAAVNKEEDRAGLGIIARDHNGKVLLAGSKTIWPFVNVESAEIEAFKWAACMVKERSWNRIIIEGDAQQVVKAFQRSITRNIYNQVLIDNTLNYVSNVDSLSFSFCYREANHAAHRLARWAASSVCSRVWFDEGPPWISDIVFADFPS